MISILFLLSSILLIYCHPNNKQLDYALRKAGENRIELEQVLTHYKNDSLKLAAASFLIENMPFHFGKEEYFLSPGGEKYRPDITCFLTANEVQAHCDSIRGKGYQSVSKNVFDITRIKSEYLIKNIDLAFEVWEKPWAKGIPFEVFCRYILPYRTQIEPLSNLREELMKRYLPLLDSAGVTTPLDACILKNPNHYDVTHEYWDILTTIFINTCYTSENKKSLIYLCTHNQGQWQPLAIGERNGNKCTVPNVRGDNVFIIAESAGGQELRYITHPFYVDTTGLIQEFIPDSTHTTSFHLPNNLQNRKNMSLGYWNHKTSRFENLPDYTEADTMTFYNNIPQYALLRFSGITTAREQRRVFFIKSDSIVSY